MPDYKSLYRKWRPKTFSEVCGQEHITKVLQNQVATQKVSHAYLFCGSRGTGKTTCAKILAKAVNCENPQNGDPCNECESCQAIESGRVIDVVEMDAASNRGIDDVRELREEAAYTPGEAAKKVYIVDEVHMFTGEAANAFLKTLEEPPAHIVFILATTDPNKLPATILSRCQRHDFRRIPPEVIAERLNFVCNEENIQIEKEAADLIARLSDGALRDALSILEVCAANLENGAVSFDYASKVLGYLDTEKMIWMCACIKNGDAEGALRGFWELYDNSFDCGNFCASLLDMFRNIQVAKLVSEPLAHIRLEKGGAEKIIALSKDFDGKELLHSTQLVGDTLISLGRYTQNKRVAIELMLVELCQRQAVAALPKQADQPAVLPKAQRSVAGGGVRRYFDKYADMIEEISKENKMIVPYLKSGKCIIDESEKKLFIYVDNDFKANVLKEEKNLAVIQNNLSKFYAGLSVAVEAQKEKKAEDPAQNSIDDILGNI